MIRFGIEETISIEEEVARIEWSRIKDILNGKEKSANKYPWSREEF
ncbi:hypothetical protein OL548_32270 [Lysinibacillus sp. MHQ-1]|nr:hypothetical protein OL548_32270 [Lysinibacillus sp. MHQ-1]